MEVPVTIAVLPYAIVRPYSKLMAVLKLLGFTKALRLAPLYVILFAGTAITVVE
jgi:hypothetical protein